MYKIKGLDFIETCFACPEQYDVFINGEQVCYVRLRWGSLYAECPDVGGETVYEASIGNDAGRFKSEDQRQYHLMQIAKAIHKWVKKKYETEADDEEPAMSHDILSVINYIDDRISENPYEGSWITDYGERVSADVGYVSHWWTNYMKPELLRKFK